MFRDLAVFGFVWYVKYRGESLRIEFDRMVLESYRGLFIEELYLVGYVFYLCLFVCFRSG